MNYISYTTSKYWLPNILMYDCLLDKQLFYLLLKLKGILVNSYGIKTGYVWVTKDTPNTWQGNYGFIRYFCNRDRSILRSAQLAFDIKTLIWKFYLLLMLSIVNWFLNYAHYLIVDISTEKIFMNITNRKNITQHSD